ncbi:MAG: ASCH domain-containing protein [Planctomycetota bacterium]|jgi:ASC-1-like (ASCH) protein
MISNTIMAKHHLVILKRPYLDLIVEGKKTIESRFTKTKREPFGQISIGDKLFLKESSGCVCATAVVSAVESSENLTLAEILSIKQKYNSRICGGDEYWESKMDCKYGVLVWLKDVEKMRSVRINKKDWRAWVVLSKKENYGLLENFLKNGFEWGLFCLYPLRQKFS